MHLLNSYALNCGLKIDKPYIHTMFYPLGESKYITIQPFSNHSGKQYDYWNEVINYMLPKLEGKGIKIVQIGKEADAPIAHSIWTQGTTSIAQASFLIKNSMLHLGVDSFGVHVASAYNKKIVSLYSTNWAENAKPYWSKTEDYILLEPDRSERKPSFQFEDEPPKTINQIKPELVADSALRLLGLNYKISHETLHIGEHYSKHNVHVVPSSVPTFLGNVKHVVVRMDLEFNEDNLHNIAQKVDNLAILTSKAIDIELVKDLKDKTQEIVYILDEDNDIEFVKHLHNSAASYILLTYLTGQELENLKFKYLDYDFIFSIEEHEKDGEELLANEDLNSLVFKANRKIIKDESAYASMANLEADKPLESLTSHEFSPVIDSPKFWEDFDYFYISKKLD